MLAGMRMQKRFVISSGTSIAVKSQTVRSARKALEVVREHMRLRRPGVIIEDAEGRDISFFQLKEMAESESRREDA
jgi:hypothetical protein